AINGPGINSPGINSLSLTADSDTKASTTATAGGIAAGGSGVGIGGAIAVTTANNDTQTYIGSGDDLILGEDLSAVATHTGVTNTKADGAASGGAAAVGIALGLNIVDDSTLATTNRTIDAGGDVTFSAHASAATSAVATASAAGAEDESEAAAADSAATKTFDGAAQVDVDADTIDLGVDHGLKTGTAIVYDNGGGNSLGGLTSGTTYYVIADSSGKVKLAKNAAEASEDKGIDLTAVGTGSGQSLAPDTQKGVDNQVNAQKSLVDKKAADSNTTGTGTTTAPSAETSSGGISVAAAVGVNLASSQAQAYIPDNGQITAGGILSLSASNNSDAEAKADGSATGSSSVGIGAAVAVNVPILKNEAYLGQNSTIKAGGLVIEALMTDVDGDTTQNFSAEATSGASGKSVAIAGSLALNIMDA
ncbi:MAG: hypothetical protein GY697_17300, partial [Desulfobacterales bacterium]|nr:hypothetical protein [Desulfobacterales bacterium]